MLTSDIKQSNHEAFAGRRSPWSPSILLASVLLLPGLLLAQDEEAPTTGNIRESELLHEKWRSIEYGILLVKDVEQQNFINIEIDALAMPLREQMYSWIASTLDRISQPEHRREFIEAINSNNLAIRVSAAQSIKQDDLIEYCWTVEGRPLRAVASLNALKLDFDLAQLPACHRTLGQACVFAARNWIESVIKLEGKFGAPEAPTKYRVELPWPDELTDGVKFSSAPEQELPRLPGMPRWHARVDAFVEDGVLSILIYKKIGQLMHFQDGSKWFDDEFRALVHRKARELGKLPQEPAKPEE